MVIDLIINLFILIDSDHYRYDSGILKLAKSDYPRVKKIIHRCYDEYQAYFQKEVLLFTKPLAPGLSIVEGVHLNACKNTLRQ
ncbi:MAG: hypothetical protein F6K44_18065 [Moorea sp. SIO3E2]|nr:hypothetical protein [Moorena sp. SIO3E2]